MCERELRMGYIERWVRERAEGRNYRAMGERELRMEYIERWVRERELSVGTIERWVRESLGWDI